MRNRSAVVTRYPTGVLRISVPGRTLPLYDCYEDVHSALSKLGIPDRNVEWFEWYYADQPYGEYLKRRLFKKAPN